MFMTSPVEKIMLLFLLWLFDFEVLNQFIRREVDCCFRYNLNLNAVFGFVIVYDTLLLRNNRNAGVRVGGR